MGRVDLASVAFDVLALVTLGSAAFVALARDEARAVVGLVGTLAGVAGLYFVLAADFLGVLQVLVSVGGTSVLFVGGRLVLPSGAGDAAPARRRAAFATALLAAALVVVGAGTMWPVEEKTVSVPSTAKIGHALLGSYALPFELAAFVLFVALVGALVLAPRPANGAGS